MKRIILIGITLIVAVSCGRKNIESEDVANKPSIEGNDDSQGDQDANPSDDEGGFAYTVSSEQNITLVSRSSGSMKLIDIVRDKKLIMFARASKCANCDTFDQTVSEVLATPNLKCEFAYVTSRLHLKDSQYDQMNTKGILYAMNISPRSLGKRFASATQTNATIVVVDPTSGSSYARAGLTREEMVEACSE